MASKARIRPSADYRNELRARGGASAARCYQCATCSSVCELATPDAPFPRQQMLLAQWGLEEQLLKDPAVWLCHHCNDCTVRCPRDARPGDVMAAIRALAVRRLAVPQFIGRLVADAGSTWPLLLGVPILFWIAALYLVHGMTIPSPPLVYDRVVPHWLIYAVFFPLTGILAAVTWTSGKRFWQLLAEDSARSGSFWRALWDVGIEISTHRRFGSCGAARQRKFAHLALVWGFVGAAVTSGLIIVALYILKTPMPLRLDHPFKVLGNVSAVLLVLGGGWLLYTRLRDHDGTRAGRPTAFDNFFFAIVLLVIATGVLVEAGRFWFEPRVAVTLYVVHLGAVFTLFYTFPYSKFAHLMYRTLAMVHERMAAPAVKLVADEAEMLSRSES